MKIALLLILGLLLTLVLADDAKRCKECTAGCKEMESPHYVSKCLVLCNDRFCHDPNGPKLPKEEVSFSHCMDTCGDGVLKCLKSCIKLSSKL